MDRPIASTNVFAKCSFLSAGILTVGAHPKVKRSPRFQWFSRLVIPRTSIYSVQKRQAEYVCFDPKVEMPFSQEETADPWFLVWVHGKIALSQAQLGFSRGTIEAGGVWPFAWFLVDCR